LWFFVLYRLVVVGLFLCFPGLYFVLGYCFFITPLGQWQSRRKNQIARERTNNLKSTRVIRKGKQFLPIAIHLCVSIIKSGRTLIRRRTKDLKQPQIICHLGAVSCIGWLLLVCFCASLVYILSSAIVFL
jgi:hypothetical protein